MAKAAVAFALVAITVLLAGPVAARNMPGEEQRRQLLQGTGAASASGSSTGTGQSSSWQNAQAGNGYGVADGATWNVGVGADGQPHFSYAVGDGASVSLPGYSTSFANGFANSAGTGSSSAENIGVGSTYGNVGSSADVGVASGSGR